MSIGNDIRTFCFGFVGFGLIGGSIAKALRRAYPDCRIIVTSRSKAPIEAACREGVVDTAADSVDSRFGSCDFVFLCTPVVTMTGYLAALKTVIKESCIITDVGSVKGIVHKAAEAEGLSACFIGGHPMAGSEQTGYANSSAGLLACARYVITPTAQTSQERLSAYTDLVTQMRAVPIVMDPALHDRSVAGISHVPHLVAAALAKLVLENDDAENHMHLLAAGGFRDTTRIAASSPEMWSQICDANRDAICPLLDEYIMELTRIREHLSADNAGQNEMERYITELFSSAGEYRKSFSFAAMPPTADKTCGETGSTI